MQIHAKKIIILNDIYKLMWPYFTWYTSDSIREETPNKILEMEKSFTVKSNKLVWNSK